MKRFLLLVALAIPAFAYAEITSMQVKLYWDNPVVQAGQSAPDHFIMQRKDAACSASAPYVDIGQVAADVFNIVDVNVQQQSTYCYRAFSVNSAGTRSAPSNTVEAAIPLGESPVVPNLRLAP